jgi:hypothetical protein
MDSMNTVEAGEVVIGRALNQMVENQTPMYLLSLLCHHFGDKWWGEDSEAFI